MKKILNLLFDIWKLIDFEVIIKDFKIETNVAGEIKVSLPYDAVEKLPHLLSQVEENKNKIGIASYGISSSTIEEVFLKLKICKKIIVSFWILNYFRIGGIDKDGNLATGENEDHKNITSNNLETGWYLCLAHSYSPQ